MKTTIKMFLLAVQVTLLVGMGVTLHQVAKSDPGNYRCCCSQDCTSVCLPNDHCTMDKDCAGAGSVDGMPINACCAGDYDSMCFFQIGG